MKLFFLLIAFFVSAIQLKAQSPYDASLIPKELLPYASSVIRRMELSTEVKDLDNTVIRYREVVTILNKNGDRQADIDVFHNKQYHIKSIKGTVYDQYGKVVFKIAERNFNDYSIASDISLFEDSRMKHFRPSVTEYPYTVEYDYEIQARQSLNFQDWRPCPAPGTAVEYSSYNFKCRPDFPIRYKELNYPGKVSITNTAQQNTYAWEIKNLRALRTEPYSPNPEEFLITVKVAPQKFKYDGYSGSFTDWKSLGQWTYDNLLKNRDVLPPATVAYIHELTDTIKDEMRKAKALYEFMQKKMRYVSVQVGIGGYRPFSASEADNVSYGDCKALVNYTQALLKAVKIDSYYCVVYGDNDKQSLLPDFASMSQGNHVILCIPFKNDTTWLECTSKNSPFGFLGGFTDDRWALACTPQGGKLLHTPKYTAENNMQTSNAYFTLKNNGELTGRMQTIGTGTQFGSYEKNADGSFTEEKKKLKEEIPINNLVIEKLHMTQNKSSIPVSTRTIDLKAADYATFSGGKYFFMINPANRISSVPRELRTRNNDVYINRGYTDVDEVTFQIPTGYRLDKNPLNITVTKPFGSFKATMVLEGDKLVYKRQMKLIDGTYPKEVYQDLVDFYQKAFDADHYNVALAKN